MDLGWDDVGQVQSEGRGGLVRSRFLALEPDLEPLSREFEGGFCDSILLGLDGSVERFKGFQVADLSENSGSLLADGCLIGDGAVIENSVIGVRCRIGRNVTIRNSILMGADFYESRDQLDANDRPPLEIGEGTLIEGAIVDKNCRIGRNVRIQSESTADSPDLNADVIIRDGVICVQKGAMLPDGWVMPSE